MASSTAPGNPLAGATLSHIMAASLPTSSPTIKTASEAIALACHAALISVGFRLVGLGEDHRISAQSDSSDPQPLPSEWNAFQGSYAFLFKHSQSSMEFVVKINRMGGKMVIMGMGLGDDRTITFDVKVDDYVSEGNLPLNGEGIGYEERSKKIWDMFITVGRLSDLGSLMRVQLIQKLVPSLQKAGYQEEERQPAPGREDNRPQHDPLREERDPPARPHPLHDPLAQPRNPRGPMPDPMPGFDDEHEILRPPRGGPLRGGFPNYGERDLYPQGLGPNDPIRGGIGPGLGNPRGGGGMHPTFDDPLFAGQGQGGYGYDPQAPPGARYDDPFGPGRGGQGGHPRGAGMGGRPPNPFGGFGDGDFI